MVTLDTSFFTLVIMFDLLILEQIYSMWSRQDRWQSIINPRYLTLKEWSRGWPAKTIGRRRLEFHFLPRLEDNVFWLRCHKVDHFAKCCKTKKIKDPFQKHPSKSKEPKRTVNQMNFGEHSNSDSDYAFSFVDEKQLIISVNIGGTPRISMIVDSGASCNMVESEMYYF